MGLLPKGRKSVVNPLTAEVIQFKKTESWTKFHGLDLMEQRKS